MKRVSKFIRNFSLVPIAPTPTAPTAKIHYSSPFQIGNENFKKHSELQQLKQTCPIYLVKQFLTHSECDHILQSMKNFKYEEASVDTILQRTSNEPLSTKIRKDIRNNEKIVFESRDIANSLYQRFKIYTFPFNSFNSISIRDMSMCAMNSRLKIYKYSCGQQFKPHVDGIFFDSERKEESRATFLIYLNDNFTGGQTKFYFDNFENQTLIVKPEKGSALIFYHTIKHEGLPVHIGEKYILRSDVMYKH